MSGTKNVIESFRDVVQDLLVPELKAVKVSVDSLHNEMAAMRIEMKLRDEKMEQLVRSGDDRNAQAIANLSQKLDFRSKSVSASPPSKRACLANSRHLRK